MIAQPKWVRNKRLASLGSIFLEMNYPTRSNSQISMSAASFASKYTDHLLPLTKINKTKIIFVLAVNWTKMHLSTGRWRWGRSGFVKTRRNRIASSRLTSWIIAPFWRCGQRDATMVISHCKNVCRDVFVPGWSRIRRLASASYAVAWQKQISDTSKR